MLKGTGCGADLARAAQVAEKEQRIRVSGLEMPSGMFWVAMAMLVIALVGAKPEDRNLIAATVCYLQPAWCEPLEKEDSDE